MATVNNVTLNIEPGSTGDKRKVTVTYGLAFDSAEVGRAFDLGIDLFGENGSDDDEAPAPPAKLYSFGFPFLSHTTVIGQTNLGRFQAVAQVGTNVLDEDPGVTVLHQPGGINVPFPHRDEVFARVTIAAQPATARSQTFRMIL